MRWLPTAAWAAVSRGVRASPLWLAIAAYAAGLSVMSVLRHQALNSNAFDLGAFDQAVWSLSRWSVPPYDSLEHVSYWGLHFEPVLFPIAGLYKLWPDARLLLIVQSVAIALGAAPICWFARWKLGSARIAALFVIVYFLYPAELYLNLSDFHTRALGGTALLYAFYFFERRRVVLCAIFAVITLACTEVSGPYVAALGIYALLSRRERLYGTALFLLGAGYTYLMVGVLIPHWGGGVYKHLERYGDSTSLSGAINHYAAHPILTGRLLVSEQAVKYLASLFSPLMLLPLLSPMTLIVAAPELVLNLLSGYPIQTDVRYYFEAFSAPLLVVSTIYATARVAERAARLHKRRRTASPPDVARAYSLVIGVLLVIAVVGANRFLGPLPMLYRDFNSELYTGVNHPDAAIQLASSIPADAAVSAQSGLVPHLSHRKSIYEFPDIRDAAYVLLATEAPWRTEITPQEYVGDVVNLAFDPSFELMSTEYGYALFRRAPAPQPDSAWQTLATLYSRAYAPSQCRQKVGALTQSPGSADKALVGSPQVDDPGYLCWGLHDAFPQGWYRAWFSVRTDRAGTDQPVAHIDVTGDAGKGILAQRELKSSDFDGTGEYQQFYLDFYSTGDLVEFRVFYEDTQTLWLDSIKVEPSWTTILDWQSREENSPRLQPATDRGKGS